MDLSQYLEARGRGAAKRLADDIGAFSSDVSNWANGRRQIPAERCPQIEAATGGTVRCEDLRPDVAWAVLRNTAEKSLVPSVEVATNE